MIGMNVKRARKYDMREGEVWSANRKAVVIILKVGKRYILATIHCSWPEKAMTLEQLKDHFAKGGFTRLGTIETSKTRAA